jgi:hypothetical protein
VTKAKAVELLNELFDSYLKMEKACLDTIIKVDGKQFTLRDRLDEITDEKIALLTAIDVLKQSSTVEAKPDNGWISVKDRLPDDKKQYLICGLHGRIDIAYYQPIGDKFSNHEPFWQGSTRRFTIVTHWRPLPEPPESEDAE